MPRNITPDSSYGDRLTKLIPGEVVGAYIAIKGILEGNTDVPNVYYYIVILGMGILIVPFYLIFTQHVRSVSQILATSLTFLIWTLSLGGPHVTSKEWYQPYWGSIAIILWTTLIPLWIRTPSSEPKRSGVGV